MTSSQHGPYTLGDTHATMGGTGLLRSNPELIPENHPQFRLQAETACMK